MSFARECVQDADSLLDAVADIDFRDAHRSLLRLHAEKSSTYGSDDDRLANFAAVAGVTGRPPEVYALERIVEKASRAIHMLSSGQGLEVREYMDIAGLALCAEALLRRSRRRPRAA